MTDKTTWTWLRAFNSAGTKATIILPLARNFQLDQFHDEFSGYPIERYERPAGYHWDGSKLTAAERDEYEGNPLSLRRGPKPEGPRPQLHFCGLGSRGPRTCARLHFLRSAAFSLRSTASMTAFRIASLMDGGLTLSVSRRCNLPIASRKDSSTRRLIWVRCDMGG